ncbi:hypothetical protein GCM10023219_23830 [Stakelama sediminis]|uniref:histidine kinase n=1 Tax=Stakelama sediminis TaxID=463200 RepID=A0A840YZK3_9SPHN|nr:HAMP domain-containing sensor histidine kinase [Stakelama sediminis]MBB5718940.1 signal transduction histidine kinase [Stakelama sediminis]
MQLRFDDLLQTVLSAADIQSPPGRESVWRQLTDLIGRRRAAPDGAALELLYSIRDQVPAPVRAASGRALEHARPPAALVKLFATDELTIARPVLRSATLAPAEWIAMLPSLSPTARSLLRNRRDLGEEVERALRSFGASDLVLGDDRPADQCASLPQTGALSTDTESDATEPEQDRHESPDIPTVAQPSVPEGFASVGAIAANMPVVAEALRKAREGDAPVVPARKMPDTAGKTGSGPFRIADVVARIDAYQQRREQDPPSAMPAVKEADGFRFETDGNGIVRWVEGSARASLVGLSLNSLGGVGTSRTDGAVTGAIRKRDAFSDARLQIAGIGAAAGDWLISATPVFDTRSGRFAGYRGTGRRPRRGERAEPVKTPAAAQTGRLRQLVHELRTPAGAITGFSEMIEAEMLGPVPTEYRTRAGAIRSDAKTLLGVIDDLDLAARIEGKALDLRPHEVRLHPLLQEIVGDLEPLISLRSTSVRLPDHEYVVAGDARAVERLFARLLATLVSTAESGEAIGVNASEDRGTIVLTFDLPAALARHLSEHGLREDEALSSRVTLGAGFSLRLVRNLASELGGGYAHDGTHLTVRLPAAQKEMADAAETR